MPVLKRPEDAKAEAVMASVLSSLTGYKTRVADDTSSMSPWDIEVLTRRGVVVEVKSRETTPSGRFDTVKLSTRKVGSILDRTHSKAVFMVVWQDAVLWVDLVQATAATIGTVSRSKARSTGLVGANDTESCYDIPSSWFRPLSEFVQYCDEPVD